MGNEAETGNKKKPILETEHLSRNVSGLRLVEDISVSVARGEVLAVAGPSGAGKSSFLRLLNRLDEPSGGTVYLDGVDYRQIPPRELRRRVGMVTQTAYLFPGTIADNLRFGPEHQGLQLGDAAIDALLEEVGLPDRAGRGVANLSGGEAQRVSLARALANDPAVLLLDEPTSSLDQESKEGVEKLLLRVVLEKALGCVLVSHDLPQAARMADRVMLLRNGRLERIGAAGEVIHAERNL